jgi:hypothetical protein
VRVRRVSIPIACVSVLLGLVCGCGKPEPEQRLRPLTSTHAVQGDAAPDELLVLNAADATNIQGPFVLREAPAVTGGLVLTLPDSAGSKGRTGSATLAFDLPESGAYRSWARVRWADECGNSLALAFDGAAKHVFQDAVYGAWHWVPVGDHEFSAGPHRAAFFEREDGVELSHLLLTRDKNFQPGAFATVLAGAPTLRRFADDFMRSPGHGLGGWRADSGRWQVAFTFDPNRMPNQYSLLGEADAGEARAVVDAKPWNGCRVAFSARPDAGAAFGLVMAGEGGGERDLKVTLRLADDGAVLELSGRGMEQHLPLHDAVRADQWHSIVVEQWAWVLRVFLDGRPIVARFDVQPGLGRPGLFVAEGRAAFDDVDIAEIPWQADDGGSFAMPWRAEGNAEWYRAPSAALLGRHGAISASWAGLPVAEVVAEHAQDSETHGALHVDGLDVSSPTPELLVARRPRFDAPGPDRVTLQADGNVLLRRVAVSYGVQRPDEFVIGPYAFADSKVQDPSDYYDFTPEERAAMLDPAKAALLKRKPVMMPLIGRDRGPWEIVHGRWQVRGGVLGGGGTDATLKHGQDIFSDLRMSLRFRLAGPHSVAEVELCSAADAGPRVRLASAPSGADAEDLLPPVVPDVWHDLELTVADDLLTARLDGGDAVDMSFTRGTGGRILLRVPAGYAEFDDVRFAIPRSTARTAFYGFDRREPDWLREGGAWIDHGGISCIYTSNWTSLVAPQASGMMWCKRTFGADVLISFEVDAFSSWHGWDQRPTHAHHPYDNIRVALSPGRDLDSGYRLELNSRDRRMTVLYRNGVEVASVPQTGDFPMQYRGKHAPYAPRKNRITLVKTGALVRAVVDGVEVLSWRDPQPIDVSAIGLGGYKTRINFSNVEIRQLGPAPDPS